MKYIENNDITAFVADNQFRKEMSVSVPLLSIRKELKIGNLKKVRIILRRKIFVKNKNHWKNDVSSWKYNENQSQEYRERRL